MRYKKSFGQHFLHDVKVLKNIVDLAGDIKNHNILEIGAGPGTLTKAILDANPISLTSIEIDNRLLDYHIPLTKKHPNYNIIVGDALKFSVTKIARQCGVIANLPYNISTVLLLNWLEYIDHFDFLILMFQKEVAKKITASPKSSNYGTISVLIQLLCNTEYCFTVKPELFSPPPKVESAVIKLTPKKTQKENLDLDALKKTLTLCFSMRRKMIKKAIIKLKGKEEAEFILNQCKIDECLRPQAVETEQFIELSRFLF